MTRFRHFIARRLITLGIRIYGQTDDEKVLDSDLKQALDMPLDAVVEVDDIPEQWKPDQKGNVVIVEPELMVKYRRGQL